MASHSIVLSPETRLRLERLFAAPDRAAAEALLVRECSELPSHDNATPTSLERVRFAVLKLSGGDLGKLEQAAEQAQSDWRDVLMMAGFASDATAHQRWSP